MNHRNISRTNSPANSSSPHGTISPATVEAIMAWLPYAAAIAVPLVLALVFGS